MSGWSTTRTVFPCISVCIRCAMMRLSGIGNLWVISTIVFLFNPSAQMVLFNSPTVYLPYRHTTWKDVFSASLPNAEIGC